MAKQTGLGWTTFSVADAGSTLRDIRNDCHDLKISTPRAVQDTTGIDKSAIERLLLLADVAITVDGTFNPAANLSHAVFSTVASTSVARSVSTVVNGATLGPVNCFVTDYPLTRAATGEFTWSVPLVLADGAVPTWS
jgi:hypothetical protein